MRKFICICLFLTANIFMPALLSAYDSDLIVKELLKTSKMPDGSPVHYTVTDDPEVTVLDITIPPGKETGWHYHPIALYAYVLEGALTVETGDGKSYTYTSGQPIIEFVNQVQNGINKTDKPVRLVVFYLGIKDKPGAVMATGPEKKPETKGEVK